MINFVKECFKCSKTLPKSEFYRHNQMGDGLLGKCKGCTKKDVSTRYYDPEGRKKVIAYERKRAQDPQRRANWIKYQRNLRANHPEKYGARQAVWRAVKSGRLEKLPCAKCGSPDSQAHHEDYSKPLDVMWLCFKHHREHHGQKVGV